MGANITDSKAFNLYTTNGGHWKIHSELGRQ